MHFDALALACVTHELNHVLLPGRVQQVILPTAQSVALELYAQGRRQTLLLEANPVEARVQVVEEKVRRGVERETPLLLLLRKYVRDAALVAVNQPDPADRVLLLDFAHREQGETRLAVELVGRATNLILMRATPDKQSGESDGRILDLLRRAPAPDTSGRVLMPGRTWTPPNVGDRLSPLAEDDAAWGDAFARFAAAPAPLWKAILQIFRGIGNSQAHEIAMRAAGSADATPAEVSPLALAHALHELWSSVRSGDWSPGVWLDGERVVGYSPWRSTLHDFAPRASFSQALSEYYATLHQPDAPAQETTAADGYAVARARVEALIAKARKRTQHTLGALAGDEPDPDEAERLRTQAQWLLALQHTVVDGQSELVVEVEEGVLRIPLEASMTPVEQAQVLYKRAAKAERAAVQVPLRRAQLVSDLEFLAQAESDLARATNQSEIEAVRLLLVESGLLGPQEKKTKAMRPPPSQPRRYRAPDGARILVGRNARQNDALTFTIARADDLWLHVRGAPGSHVVIQSDGRAPAQETVLLAAQLAAWHSDKRGDGMVDVIVAERRRLSRPPGGRPGQVIVREERVVRVPAENPAIEEEVLREKK